MVHTTAYMSLALMVTKTGVNQALLCDSLLLLHMLLFIINLRQQPFQ